MAHSSAHAAPLARGDYDNDGKSDLAVAEVDRTDSSNNAVGTTTYVARGSNLGQLWWTFSRPADAITPGRFFSNWGTVPAFVTVTASSEPLLWTVRAPSGSDVLVRFGLPGDTIINLIDWDGDLIDDFLVVRLGTANEFGDGNSYYHWFTALSGSGGKIVEHIFGISGDRLFTYYDQNHPKVGAVRVGTAGECAGQLEWYGANFTSNPADLNLVKRCWGLPGDIPLVRADFNNNGKADWIVARPEANGLQNAYILYDNQTDFVVKALGLANSIPQIGNFKGSQTFAWSQRDIGQAAILLSGGSLEIFPFGISTNAVIRADGTVVQPSSADTLPSSGSSGGGSSGGGGGSGGTASCPTTRSSGFLYKPESQDSGGTREGFPMIKLNGGVGGSCADVLATDGTIISKFGMFTADRWYEGYKCGLDAGRDNSDELAAAARAASGNPGGYVKIGSTCYGPISNFENRYDVR